MDTIRRGNAATNGTRFSSVGQDDSVSSSKLHPHHATTKKGGGIDGHVSPKSIAAPASCTTSVYVSFSKNSFLQCSTGLSCFAGAKVRLFFEPPKYFGYFFHISSKNFFSLDKHQRGHRFLIILYTHAQEISSTTSGSQYLKQPLTEPKKTMRRQGGRKTSI